MFFAFPQLRRRLAAQADFNFILDVADVQAVARGAVAVNGDDGLRHFARAVNERALHAGHVRDAAQDLGHLRAQNFRVFAKNFDDDLTVNLRNAFQHVVADGLGETRFHARQRVEGLVHRHENLRFRHAGTPFGRRFQVHETLGHVDRFGVSAVFGPPGFRDDGLHFGNGVQQLPDSSCLSHGLVDGNAGRQVGVDPDRSLVEFRQELCSHARQHREARHQRGDCGDHHGPRPRQPAAQHRLVNVMGETHDGVLLVRKIFPQQEPAQLWHECE